MILAQHQPFALLKYVAPMLALHIRQVPKIAEGIAKRFNSKCGGGSDGKGKMSKKGEKDNLSAVLYGIEDLRLVSKPNDLANRNQENQKRFLYYARNSF